MDGRKQQASLQVERPISKKPSFRAALLRIWQSLIPRVKDRGARESRDRGLREEENVGSGWEIEEKSS